MRESNLCACGHQCLVIDFAVYVLGYVALKILLDFVHAHVDLKFVALVAIVFELYLEGAGILAGLL